MREKKQPVRSDYLLGREVDLNLLKDVIQQMIMICANFNNLFLNIIVK